jgi:plastocyanin
MAEEVDFLLAILLAILRPIRTPPDGEHTDMRPDRLGRPATVLLAVAVPIVALVTVVVTLNVTTDGTSAAAGRNGTKTANAIDIENFRFSPDPLVVRAGTPVKVTNSDRTVHTVTAADKSFDTGDLAGGASTTITITKPGAYKYFCNIHNYMTGTIEVR